MRNTLGVECIGQALQNYIEAKNEHDTARDNYDGYSWGYHGRIYVERMEDAAEEFQNYLDKYVEAKVKQILEQEKVKQILEQEKTL